MRPVSRVAMAAALALSALSMLAHNLYELPLSPIDGTEREGLLRCRSVGSR